MQYNTQVDKVPLASAKQQGAPTCIREIERALAALAVDSEFEVLGDVTTSDQATNHGLCI